jgi:hypothetical protein
VVPLLETKRGFVLSPRQWLVERALAWAKRFRRLVRDYERLPQTLAELHVIALVCLMLRQAANYIAVRNSLQAAFRRDKNKHIEPRTLNETGSQLR